MENIASVCQASFAFKKRRSVFPERFLGGEITNFVSPTKLRFVVFLQLRDHAQVF